MSKGFEIFLNVFFFLAFLGLGIGLGHYMGEGMERTGLIENRWGGVMVLVVAPVVMVTIWKPVARKQV